MAYNAVEFPSLENRMKKEKKGLLSRFWGWKMAFAHLNFGTLSWSFDLLGAWTSVKLECPHSTFDECDFLHCPAHEIVCQKDHLTVAKYFSLGDWSA
jgi:hypothetical protein